MSLFRNIFKTAAAPVGRTAEEQRTLDDQLLSAAAAKSEARVKAALSAGANVNAQDDTGKTPVLIMLNRMTWDSDYSTYTSMNMLKILVSDYDADLTIQDHSLVSAESHVQHNEYKGYANPKKLFDITRSQVRGKPRRLGWELLSEICQQKPDTTKIKNLINAGADLTQRGKMSLFDDGRLYKMEGGDPLNPSEGDTVFILALKRAPEMLDYLLAKNPALIDMPAENGATPLAIAVAAERYDIAEWLLKKGAKVDEYAAASCRIALKNAASDARDLVIKAIILKDPALMEAQDEDGTALMQALAKGQRDLARWMVEMGADVNAENDSYSVLRIALKQEKHRAEMVKMLLDAGADPHVKPAKGYETAIETAEGMRLMELRDMMLAANPGVQSQKAQSQRAKALATQAAAKPPKMTAPIPTFKKKPFSALAA